MSEIIEYVHNSSMLLGSGYDFSTREVKLSPLAAPIHKVQEAKGPSELKLAFIESATHLSEFLDIGVEGSYDALMFGGSAKAEFVTQTSIDEYSLLLVVVARCVNGVEIVSQPQPSADALALAAKGDLIGFRRSFGDRYVSALTRGGELYGLIRIQTKNVSEQQSLKAQASAHGFGWSSRVAVEAFLKNVSSQHSITVECKINGLSGYANPTSAAALFKLAEDFPVLVAKQGTPLKVELRAVSELPKISLATSKISEDTMQALLLLSDHYLDYTVLSNNIRFMLSPSGKDRFDFDTVSKDTIHAQQDKVQKQLRALRLLADKLIRGDIKYNDPSIEGFTPAYLFDDSLKLPNEVESLQIPPVAIFPLRRNTRGDSEMDGHHPIIDINASLQTPPSHAELQLSIQVKMREDRSDWTTFEDSWLGTVLDLRQSGRKIVSFHPNTGALHAQAGSDDHDFHWYTGSGLVKRAYCRSDTDGSERNRIGAKPIEFQPVKVVIGEPPPPPKPGPHKLPKTKLREGRTARLEFWRGKPLPPA